LIGPLRAYRWLHCRPTGNRHQKVAFDVRDNRLTAHIKTDGEQVFTDDHYNVDLSFSAPLEP
jgi:hypothetical protein